MKKSTLKERYDVYKHNCKYAGIGHQSFQKWCEGQAVREINDLRNGIKSESVILNQYYK